VNRKLISFAAAFALMMSPQIMSAQSATPVAQSDHSVGPTISANTAGIRAPTSARSLNARAADNHMGAGENVALMVVGGAALIVGAVIGGTPGLLIAIGGAVIGLYGLYHFIQ
jgi:hypothetical protein